MKECLKNYLLTSKLSDPCETVFTYYNITIPPNLTQILTKNLTNLTQSKTISRPFLPSIYLQIFWVTLFGLMVLIALIGNLAVIWIILINRRMRTVTNYFLLNLSLADLFMVTFNAMFNFIYMLKSNWPFGEFYCKFSNFVANTTVASSVFTIAALSIERFIVVISPLKPRLSGRKSILIITFIWLGGSILSLPPLIFSQTFDFTYDINNDNNFKKIELNDGSQYESDKNWANESKEFNNDDNTGQEEGRIICQLYWPDGEPGFSYMDYVYNMIFFILTYALPMVSMIITYSLIGWTLWKNKEIGEITTTQKEIIKTRRKLIPMLITVTGLFGLCWLPYHIYFLYTYGNVNITRSKYIQHVYLAIYWLAMMNSAFNPIIYALFNKRFRSHYKKTLLCWCNKGDDFDSIKKTNQSLGRSQMNENNTNINRMNQDSYKRSKINNHKNNPDNDNEKKFGKFLSVAEDSVEESERNDEDEKG